MSSNLLPLLVLLLAANLPAQTDVQVQALQAKVYEAQKAIDDKQYDSALAATLVALQQAERMPDTYAQGVNARAISQTLMGLAYTGQAKYSEAIEVFRKAIPIYQRLSGVESNYGLTLEKLADCHRMLGDNRQAIENYIASADMYEKAGKLDEAIQRTTSAIEMLAALPKTADSISKLVTANFDVGRWQQKSGNCNGAIEHYASTLTYLDHLNGSEIENGNNRTLKALADCLETLGSANDWIKGGSLLHELKRYALAAGYFSKGLAIYENGRPDPVQLANFHQKIAFEFGQAKDWEQARRHLAAKLEILAKLENSVQEQASAWHDLGVAEENLSRFQEALDAHRKALALYESVPGTEPQRAEVSFRAADAAINLKNNAEALKIATAALPLYDAAKNTKSYNVFQHAYTLMRIGDLLAASHRADEALPYYSRSLFLSEGLQDISGDTNVPLSLKRAQVQWTLGALQAIAGHSAEALPNLRDGFLEYHKSLIAQLPVWESSERAGLLVWSATMARYLYRAALADPRFVTAGLQAALCAKSLEAELARAAARLRADYAKTNGAADVARLKQLRQLSARLVLLQAGDYATVADPEGKLLKNFAAETLDLEASVRKHAAAVWDAKSAALPTLDSLQHALRGRDILLEFVTFTPDATADNGFYTDFIAPLTARLSASAPPKRPIEVEVSNAEFYKGDIPLSGRKPEAADKEHYAVFVLNGPEGKPAAFDLGRRSIIDDAISDYRRAYESQVDPNSFHLDESALASRAAKLRRLLLDPVLASLPKSDAPRRLYISAAGSIGLLPFEALPTGGSAGAPHYLIEDYELAYLANAAALLAATRSAASRDVWLIGDPDFNTSSEPAKTYQDSIPNAWLNLTGTAALLDGVEQRVRTLGLQPTVLRRAAANESALGGIHSPRMLLFATHGYFMADTVPLGRMHIVVHSPLSTWAPETELSLDPAMRSMLVLAGANQRYRPLRSAAPQPEDGLLTAYEARDLDLRDTDLVVLVGCESSVGAVPRTNWHFPANTVMAAGMGMQASGTGQSAPMDTQPRLGDDAINGLPAAFFVAGARSIVSSAWTIPVQSTSALIGDFLETWLHKNQGRNRFAAFHTAQIAALKRAREQGDTHPFRWAGMMYTGSPDDAP